MIRLNQWYLSEYKHNKKICYLARGYVYGHPRLTDGISMHTSQIESISFDSKSNKLFFITHSKNEYELAMSDINLDCYRETENYLKKFDISIPTYEECKILADEVENEVKSYLDGIIKDGELYLKMVGVFVRKAYWKNKEIRNIDITVHVGMFQDSYLVTDWEKYEVDFRYFDGYERIEPYHYSDGLNAILIENIGGNDFRFRDGQYSVICKAGEVTRIESKYFHSEGLISPDVVNGKSALFNNDDSK